TPGADPGGGMLRADIAVRLVPPPACRQGLQSRPSYSDPLQLVQIRRQCLQTRPCRPRRAAATLAPDPATPVAICLLRSPRACARFVNCGCRQQPPRQLSLASRVRHGAARCALPVTSGVMALRSLDGPSIAMRSGGPDRVRCQGGPTLSAPCAERPDGPTYRKVNSKST